MGFRKFSPELIGEIKGLLRLKWSHSAIIKELKSRDIHISKGYLSKINNCENNENRPTINKKKTPVGRPPKITNKKLRVLSDLVNKPDPLSQRKLAKKLNISQQ